MAPPDPAAAAGRSDAPQTGDPAAARLAVVILNWNRTRTTLECLASLSGWRRLEPELWVVDNASDDGGPERIRRRFPRVRLLAAPSNLGFGGGNNLALRQIESAYVLLLNNDARIDEAGVTALLEWLDADPTIAVAGPVVAPSDEPRRILAAGGRDILRHVRTHLTAAELEPGQIDGPEPFDVDYVPGSVAVLRMRTVRRLGYLDEEYFFGGELADLCRRSRDQGERSVVLPGARASHDLEVASRSRRELYPYYILRNRFLYLRKFAGASAPLYIALWIGLGLALAARAGLRRDWAEGRALLLGLRDGLARRGGNGNHHFER